MVKVIGLVLDEGCEYPKALIKTNEDITSEGSPINDGQFDNEIVEFVTNNFENPQVRNAYLPIIYGEYDMAEILMEQGLLKPVDFYPSLNDCYDEAEKVWKELPEEKQIEFLKKYIPSAMDNYGYLIEYERVS